MQEKSNNLYRLRIGTQLIGYMMESNGEYRFKSEKMLWWLSGKIPKYDSIDEYVQLNDINGDPIFELDLVKYKIDSELDEWDRGVIVWDEKNKAFGILDIMEGVFIPFKFVDIKLFEEDQLEIADQLYMHPTLQQKLGLSNL